MPQMPLWDELVKTALLGTERQKPLLPANEADALHRLIALLDAEDRERALLSASAALALSRRAGYLPEIAAESEASPVEADDLPRCREAAVGDLTLLLNSEFEALLPEWLHLVAQRRERVWDRRLPDLLEKGARQPDLRDALSTVIGKRGRWLAAQNPAGHYALQQPATDAGEMEEAAWEMGLQEERTAYLRAQRRIDPARARQTLQAAWAQEAPEARAAFLQTFEIGLSMDDEPFIETCLDDRRKEVRTVAQALLRALPQSRLCGRMIERARLCVTVQRTLIARKLIVTLPPETFEKAMARDGIDQKPAPYLKVGERAFWLSQILSATPLGFWETHLNGMPDQLIALATADKEWSELLLAGWTAALTHEQGVSAWAEPLLNYGLVQRPIQTYNAIGSAVSLSPIPWKRVLPPDRLETIALRFLNADTFRNYSHPLWAILASCGPVWSENLSNHALNTLEEAVGAKENQKPIQFLPEVADLFPDEKVDALYALWDRASGQNEYHQRQRQQHVAQTEFRRQMRQHISGD